MNKVLAVIEEIKRMREENRPPHPVELSYDEELELIWGKRWGAQSEIGKLKSTLVKRPGEEFQPQEIFDHQNFYDIHKKTDMAKVQEEHDKFVDILKKEGVKVFYVKTPELAHGPYTPANPRIWGARDPGIVINGGAIVGRMSLPWRKKDEFYWAKAVMELGCPILYTVNRKGTFEGGNVVWLDPKHVCIGETIRTNAEGVRQVAWVMKEIGGVEEVYKVPMPGYLKNLEWPAGGYAHLDVAFGMADINLALVYPPALPYEFLRYLKKWKISLIEVPPEEYRNEGCNILALEPRKIIMNSGCDKSRRQLKKEGIDVIETPFSEVVKSGGAAHCSTGPLEREPGPFLE